MRAHLGRMRFFLGFSCWAAYFVWDFGANGGAMTVRVGTALARMLH